MNTFRTTDARTLAYTVAGEGPLVVMLPGGPGIDPAAFYAGAQLPGFRQLILFPRGTGVSDPPASADGYEIAGYIDDVEELRVHLDLPHLNLYGSSHGASIALGYASAHPERVSRMVLAAGPARMDKQFAKALAAARVRFENAAPHGVDRLAASDEAARRMRSAETAGARQQATRAMIDTYIAHPTAESSRFLDKLAQAPANPAAIPPMVAEMMGGLDLLANADSMTSPTLVLTGELDVRVPAEHEKLIADTLPNAELTMFMAAGHLLHVEAPSEWASAVGAFLRKQ